VFRSQQQHDKAFDLYMDILAKAQPNAKEKNCEETELTISTQQTLAHLHGRRYEVFKELELLEAIAKWKQDNLKSNRNFTTKKKKSQLQTRQNLRCCYKRLKTFKEAKETFKVVYEERLKLLGESHPSALNTMHDLAVAMLHFIENVHHGINYLEEVLIKSIEVLKESHRRTNETRNAIAHWKGVYKSESD